MLTFAVVPASLHKLSRWIVHGGRIITNIKDITRLPLSWGELFEVFGTGSYRTVARADTSMVVYQRTPDVLYTEGVYILSSLSSSSP